MLHPATIILDKAKALELTESTICGELIAACEDIVKESDCMEKMDSCANYEDLYTGKSAGQRAEEEAARLAKIQEDLDWAAEQEVKRLAREERRRERDEGEAMAVEEAWTWSSQINQLASIEAHEKERRRKALAELAAASSGD